MFRDFFHFITVGIWRIRMRDLSRAKAIVIQQIRVFLLTLRGFHEDRCYLRASALTFYTLIAIVPIFAMALGIAKGFGIEEKVQSELLEKFHDHKEVAAFAIDYAHRLLDHSVKGLIAGLGVLVLFWTVMKLLSNIERSFNDIWGIRRLRTLSRRISDYISIIVVCPILLIFTSGITVFIYGKTGFILEKVPFLQTLDPIIHSAIGLIPYVLLWAIFAFLYIFLPNTKVKPLAGIAAGVIAGTIYQFVQWAYIKFQIGVANYDAVYGSFAALPLFLVWLQISWLVVLLGAELAFAFQHVDTYEFEPDCLKVSPYFKKIVTLRVAHMVVSNFCDHKPPLTTVDISNKLDVPFRMINEVIFELCQAGLFTEITLEDKSLAYQPAYPLDKFSLYYILNAIEHHGNDNIPYIADEKWKKIQEAIDGIESIEKDVLEQISL